MPGGRGTCCGGLGVGRYLRLSLPSQGPDCAFSNQGPVLHLAPGHLPGGREGVENAHAQAHTHHHVCAHVCAHLHTGGAHVYARVRAHTCVHDHTNVHM